MSNLDEDWYVDLIKKNSPYKDVALASEISLDLIHHKSTSPKIQIGHEEIKSSDLDNPIYNGYSELEGEEILVTSIQVICPRKGWVKVRNTIKKAYQGKSPFEDNEAYSSLFTIGTEVIQKTNRNIQFIELVGVAIPRII